MWKMSQGEASMRAGTKIPTQHFMYVRSLRLVLARSACLHDPLAGLRRDRKQTMMMMEKNT
jgi:hypothetical protein